MIRGAYKAQSPTLSVGLIVSQAGAKLKPAVIVESLANEDPNR